MADAKSVLYSPYGGFQLKATYQRNLLLANLVVMAMIASLLASAHLWGTEGKPPGGIVPIESEAFGPFKPFAPPVIIKEVPAVKVVRPKQAIREGSIWRPVADEAIANESVIYADEEMFVGPAHGTGIGEVREYSGYSEYSESADGYVPPRDTFISLEKQPEMVASVTPPYPRLARRAGISGTVWIRALIGKNGKVRLAEVHKSSGSASLDEAAVQAAYKCVFSPGIQNGRPVSVWVSYRVEFKLED